MILGSAVRNLLDDRDGGETNESTDETAKLVTIFVTALRNDPIGRGNGTLARAASGHVVDGDPVGVAIARNDEGVG